ncbi:hypothetical protein MPSEU_000294800 [Mayamaea pseudoterrestris]|nr:hypothetical protein MPSEU_000294800 [Mayamaea pseudoterrestris]
MAKKRRHTAKTGDKSLYKSREDVEALKKSKRDDDDDEMDAADRHFAKDFLKLDHDQESSDDDDSVQEEGVMNLGIRGDGDDDDDDEDVDDSSSDDADSDMEDIRRGSQKRSSKKATHDDDEEDLVSSSDDDEEEEEMEDVRDWGRKKSAYYHGDTADLEIGQDADDAYLEEEAAKEVQAARFKDMSEDDFLDESDTEKEKVVATGDDITIARDSSKLSVKEKRKYLDKQHPEMLPLLSYFSTIVEDLKENTSVAALALLEGEAGTAEAVGATRTGQQYLLTKYLAQLSTVLNMCIYLLLKSEQARQEDAVDPALIQTHPVMVRLHKLNSTLQKLETGVEDRVDGLREQLSNLVKAASLMNNGELSEAESEEDDDNEEAVEVSDAPESDEGSPAPAAGSEDEVDQAGISSDEASVVDEKTNHRRILNEARFGVRLDEVREDARAKTNRRRRPADFGDFNDEAEVHAKSLASTLNTIEQRSASKKRKINAGADDIDDVEKQSDQLRRGIEMMEAEFGKDFDKHDGGGDGNDSDNVDPELDEDDFYGKVATASKSRKEARKKQYEVAPKYPRLESVIDGERGVSKQIMKNRGLVAHKNKLNRNPRVKKREQYRKALIRRKGAVRDVRTDEGHKYDGEGTGIKSNISRSRKLAS